MFDVLAPQTRAREAAKTGNSVGSVIYTGMRIACARDNILMDAWRIYNHMGKHMQAELPPSIEIK